MAPRYRILDVREITRRSLTFDSCAAATLDYDLTEADVQGSIPLQRVVDDNEALCEALR